MIDARVLAIKPHPDQATNNPGCWAVRFEVSHNGTKRTFWRWHTVRKLNENGFLVKPDNQRPSTEEVLAEFWSSTFGELHGFAFNKDDP